MPRDKQADLFLRHPLALRSEEPSTRRQTPTRRRAPQQNINPGEPIVDKSASEADGNHRFKHKHYSICEYEACGLYQMGGYLMEDYVCIPSPRLWSAEDI